MMQSGITIQPALMATTIIRFFFVAFRSPSTSIFWVRNNWMRPASASCLEVALSSGESLVPSTAAALSGLDSTGTSFAAWLASGACEAGLGDTSTSSLVDLCCLEETGTDAAEPESRGLSSVGDKIASRSADWPNGFGGFFPRKPPDPTSPFSRAWSAGTHD